MKKGNAVFQSDSSVPPSDLVNFSLSIKTEDRRYGVTRADVLALELIYPKAKR